MVSRTRDPYRRVPHRALVLAGGALAVPLLGTTFFRGALGDQEPLLWLLALVPAFLLAYYRGWRGASVALAAGMAALAIAHPSALWLGGGLSASPLLVGVVAAFIFSALGAGWTSELLHRRFLLAQEHATELTLIVDEEGTIRYASPSSRRILGMKPEDLVHTKVDQLLEPGSGIPALMDDGTEIGEDTVQLHAVAAGGAVRVLEASVVDHRQDPRVAGLVLRARDVTERVRSEEQNRRLFRMQAITQLARALAHDFNNVLTTIQGNAQLLQEDMRGDINVERGVREILAASDRASRFVEQLLAFTRQQVLRPRPMDLNAMLVESQPRLQELLGTATRMVLELADDLPEIFVDPAELRRILLVLAARAGEGMPDGGEFRLATNSDRITEATASQHSFPVLPGEYALLTATDSGPELSDAARSRIFEPFAMAVGEASTGLELSSVYGTIKQSGGYVWVDSDAAVGTSFRFFLPVATVVAEQAAPPQSSGRRGTVLIAEDDAHVRALVSRVLLKEGYYVLEAADGEEALRMAEHMGGRLDMVVSDMYMPKMGGRELGEALRVIYPALPILFMSGQPDTAPPEGSDQDVAFIQKPFSPGSLAETLRTLHDRQPA